MHCSARQHSTQHSTAWYTIESSTPQNNAAPYKSDLTTKRVNICLQGFFEERALLLGRLGRHEEALAIYIHVLNDITMASQ